MTQPKRIQRRRTTGWRMPENAVYVGRPSRYGNPFVVGDRYMWLGETNLPYPVPTLRQEGEYEHGLRVVTATLDDALAWYRQWAALALTTADWEYITGMDLACWCPLDRACHADFLLTVNERGF